MSDPNPTRVFGLDGQDITSRGAFLDYIEGHLDEVRHGIEVAFLAVRSDLLAQGGLLAASVGEIYFEGVRTDGQYLEVQVGVGNLTTRWVEVDSTCGKVTGGVQGEPHWPAA